MTPDSPQTAEEALARALHEAGWGPDDRLFASEIVARLAEAGYRIEAAGLREALRDCVARFRDEVQLHGDLYDRAQEFIEPSPEYDEWLRAAASDLGTLIRVAFRLLDEVAALGENPEAADWRNAAIEGGAIRPGGGVVE